LLIAAEDGCCDLCLQALEIEAQTAKIDAIQQAALVVGGATKALLQAAPACRVQISWVSQLSECRSMVLSTLPTIAA
jgi:hypothetical protein